MEPLPIALIKLKYDVKSEKYFVKLKLCRDPTSSTLDLYEFRMSLFDNGKPGFLFVRNFNMTPAASGTLDTGANIQYICTIFHGEELCQFYSLSAGVKSMEPLTVEYIIKGLSLYCSPVNFLSYKKA